nr:rep protein [Actinomycetes bacterium]
MWTSRDGWLTGLGQWASSSAFTGAKASARVSITAATLLAVAAVMAEHADHGTGRHVAVTRATIADRVGCSPDTVTVAWRLLRVAGWVVEAQRGHGSPSTPTGGRRPSVYHLVSRCEPRPVVHNPDLPPKAGVCISSSVDKYSPSARTAHAAANPSKKRRPCRAAPRPLPVQRLAAELVARCHGLHRGHIGAVCDAITAAGIDPQLWPARAITDALNADMAAHGRSWPDRIERPGAFLASRLRRIDWRPAGPPNNGGCAASPDT